MKNLLTTQWNLFRIIRLVLGTAAIVQGVIATDVLLLVAGSIVSLMAVLNVGCCGTSACSLPQKQNLKQNKTEVIYEEVVK